jgi:uncharacterized protein (TIGR02266 family)
MTEKRQHVRIPVELTVSYASRGDLQMDLVTDISAGGLFVRTNNPQPVGTEIDLSVVIGPTGPRISVKGRVTWRREHEPHKGMGIEFQGILGPILADMVEETRRERAKP